MVALLPLVPAAETYERKTRSQIARPSPDDPKALVKEVSLWYLQARILLTFYATMSGENDLFLRTMQDNGFYSVVSGFVLKLMLSVA